MRFTRLLVFFLVIFNFFTSFIGLAQAAAIQCTPQTKGAFQKAVDDKEQCGENLCFEPKTGGLVNKTPADCYAKRQPTAQEKAKVDAAADKSITDAKAVNYKETNLLVTNTPAKPTLLTPRMTITVTADKDVFLTGQTYSTYIEPQSIPLSCRVPGTYGGRARVVSARIIEIPFTINTAYCNKIVGDWKATLYYGEQYTYSTIPENLKVFNNYAFTIYASDFLQVSSLKSPLAANEKPTVIVSNAVKGKTYTFWWDGYYISAGSKMAESDGYFQLEVDSTKVKDQAEKDHRLCAIAEAASLGSIITDKACEAFTTFKFSSTPVTTTANSCAIEPAVLDTNSLVLVKALNVEKNRKYRVDLVTPTAAINIPALVDSGDSGNVTLSVGKQVVGIYDINVYKDDDRFVCTAKFEVKTPEKAAEDAKKAAATKKTCTRVCVSNDEVNEVCLNGECVPASRAAGDINVAKNCLNTAIGCVPISLNAFINGLLAWTAGIAGGIAFLLMIMGSLEMVTSQGNAEQLKKGREQFIAAISGLLFIIFSITLLQIIGADILGIFPR